MQLKGDGCGRRRCRGRGTGAEADAATGFVNAVAVPQRAVAAFSGPRRNRLRRGQNGDRVPLVGGNTIA
jgi:hypothetical protein